MSHACTRDKRIFYRAVALNMRLFLIYRGCNYTPNAQAVAETLNCMPPTPPTPQQKCFQNIIKANENGYDTFESCLQNKLHAQPEVPDRYVPNSSFPLSPSGRHTSFQQQAAGSDSADKL